MQFKTFGKLPTGAIFHIRNIEWTKCPQTMELGDGTKFNAFATGSHGENIDAETLHQIEVFDEAALVQVEDPIKVASWAKHFQNTGQE